MCFVWIVFLLIFCWVRFLVPFVLSCHFFWGECCLIDLLDLLMSCWLYCYDMPLKGKDGHQGCHVPMRRHLKPTYQLYIEYPWANWHDVLWHRKIQNQIHWKSTLSLQLEKQINPNQHKLWLQFFKSPSFTNENPKSQAYVFPPPPKSENKMPNEVTLHRFAACRRVAWPPPRCPPWEGLVEGFLTTSINIPLNKVLSWPCFLQDWALAGGHRSSWLQVKTPCHWRRSKPYVIGKKLWSVSWEFVWLDNRRLSCFESSWSSCHLQVSYVSMTFISFNPLITKPSLPLVTVPLVPSCPSILAPHFRW